MPRLLALLLLALLPSSLLAAPTKAPAEEWRSAWVTRFEWTNGDRATVSSRITRIMADLAAAHLNAVIFQVRGQGDTLYPSAEEPWSPLISESARGFDPVQHAVQEARKNGLQFHAWMNLSVIWQSGDGKLPKDRRHPLYKFADAKNPNARAGLIHDSKGKPRQFGADDYVWLTHGNPEVNAYLRRQVINFAGKYRIDGIHLDDRTGDPNGVSRDPVSVARFKGRGNPAGIKDLGDWQRDQLTRFLSDLYVQLKAGNPRLLVTISPFGIADRSRIPGYSRFSDAEKFGVEPEKWLRLGVTDALIPQIYWDEPNPAPNYSTVLKDWLSHNKSGRPIWPGSALGKYGSEQPLVPVQVRYLATARSLGAGGNSFFSYGGASSAEWRAAGKSLYPTKARVPVPAHLRPGQSGQVMGWVKDAKGKALVDCWVRIDGRNAVYLTSADGFFGIPNLKPGVYTLTFTGAGGKTSKKQVTVKADATARVDVGM